MVHVMELDRRTNKRPPEHFSQRLSRSRFLPGLESSSPPLLT